MHSLQSVQKLEAFAAFGLLLVYESSLSAKVSTENILKPTVRLTSTLSQALPLRKIPHQCAVDLHTDSADDLDGMHFNPKPKEDGVNLTNSFRKPSETTRQKTSSTLLVYTVDPTSLHGICSAFMYEFEPLAASLLEPDTKIVAFPILLNRCDGLCTSVLSLCDDLQIRLHSHKGPVLPLVLSNIYSHHSIA